jgi:oxygen-independent coproporphyrinogen-3 oxidase
MNSVLDDRCGLAGGRAAGRFSVWEDFAAAKLSDAFLLQPPTMGVMSHVSAFPSSTSRAVVAAPLDFLSPPRAAYIHVPFCAHRCGYCNFTLVSGRDDLIEDYLTALERELSWLATPREVDTLFIGGGTPTRLSPAQMRRLLTIVRHWFPLAAGYEFSIEANPVDVDEQRVAVLAELGVNRLSLGVQSFDAGKLQLLERDHRAEDIVRAVGLARGHVASLSLDLIFACPGETLETWTSDLIAALALRPDHLSTYGLTFERGTAFWSRLQKQELTEAGEELQRVMYTTAIDRLAAEGFDHYEVSNFARSDHRCRHNEAYWAGNGYYAAGPGAARYVDGQRETNHRSTTTYLRRVLAGQSPVAECEELSPEDKAREMLVLGLRRLEGVARREFALRTGYEMEQLAGPELASFQDWGLVAEDGGRLRLTRNGLCVSDGLWPKILRR